MGTLRTLALLALALASPLRADFFTAYWDQGSFVHPESAGMGAVGAIGRSDLRLRIQDAPGPGFLEAPPLDGQPPRGYCQTLVRWRGVSYAVVRRSHPVFERVGDFWNPKDHSNRHDSLPQILYRRLPGAPWKVIAQVQKPFQYDFTAFLPLEDGRFLVGLVFKPMAIYRIDGVGRFVLDQPVPMEFGGFFTPLRTQAGITLLDAAGPWVRLSNVDGHRLAQGTAAFRGGTLVAAAPRPDGRLLLTTREPCIDPLQGARALGKRRPWNPSERLVFARLRERSMSFQPIQPSGPTPLAWWALDPTTGTIQALAPPLRVPATLEGFPRQFLAYSVLPDSTLEFMNPPFPDEALWYLLAPRFSAVSALWRRR